MRNPLEAFDINNNFWTYNPEFKIPKPLYELYRKDTSRDKFHSSRIMWGILNYVYPKSMIYNLPNKEELIAKDLIKDTKFKWDDYADIIQIVKDMCLTQAQRSLVEWDEYMKKRDKYLRSTDYYFDQYATNDDGDNIITKTGNLVTIKGTAEQLDKAWLSSKAMWKDYESIQKLVEEEDSKLNNKNKIQSSTATGEI